MHWSAHRACNTGCRTLRPTEGLAQCDGFLVCASHQLKMRLPVRDVRHVQNAVEYPLLQRKLLLLGHAASSLLCCCTRHGGVLEGSVSSERVPIKLSILQPALALKCLKEQPPLVTGHWVKAPTGRHWLPLHARIKDSFQLKFCQGLMAIRAHFTDA